MAILTRKEVRDFATNDLRYKFAKYAAADRAEHLLSEHFQKSAEKSKFDVFLSHRFVDKEEVWGLICLLEDSDISVFVDWRERPEIDRQNVTKATAAALKKSMSRCTTLLFAVTSTSGRSIWMPWELGLFDGMGGRAATVPLADPSQNFPGQEYIGLYPWVDATSSVGKALWVNEGAVSDRVCVSLRDWIDGKRCVKQ